MGGNRNMEKTTEKHVFGAEVSKVLKLMIHSLYTNKDIFLRELVSNASDACDKLRYQALTKPELLSGDSEFKIRVSVDKDKRTIAIADNGIGMSRDELIANLGTIARSGTQEFLSGIEKKDVNVIGQFGVGFYSAFMVADRVEVVSCRAGESETHIWESDGEGEYTVSASDEKLRGTRITLHMRKDAEEYLDSFRLKHIIQTYSDHIAFPVEVESEVVNRASALWMRPKAEITPDQYKEFYRHVAHSPEEPWLTIHQKAEGKLEYTALLFVPGIKPFDLFHPDRLRRVKLYIKRVFITDQNVEIIPHWLRFLRGVIDSEDLPLNISRETLQSSPMLAKIREGVVKRVLSEFKKKAESDGEGYAKFWANFGPVLKEGLCEGIGSPREQILEVCRFASTHGEALAGLDDYISRMQSEQEFMYYLTGESADQLRASPLLEGFAKRGIEVLLLSDHVDDFWLSVVQEYKGKKFKSITRADIELPKADDVLKPGNAQLDELCARFKKILSEQVADVRVTSKLESSPACLAVEEGAMDIRLERFLIEQKQLQHATPKILEINPQHAVVRALIAKLSDANAEAEFEDAAWLLFEQARVLEGESVADPAGFSRRIGKYLEKGLAA